MRQLLVRVLIVMLVLCIFSFRDGYVRAEEDAPGLLEDTPIEVSSDIAFYSKYVWRGFLLDDDPVIQPGVYISMYGFSVSIWSSWDLDNDDMLTSDEVDYSAGYEVDLSEYIELPVSVSGGFTYFDFPAADLATREFYGGIAFDVLLSPAFTWYHDFGEEDSGGADGNYITAEVSHSIPIPDMPVSLDLSCLGGYNDEFFIAGEGGYVDLGAGLTIKLSENCTVSPNAHYSIPFEDLEDAGDGNQDDEFYFGVVVAFSL